MGVMAQKTKRTENMKDYINKVLRNQEIDCGDEWWDHKETWDELQGLAAAQKDYVTDFSRLNKESREKVIAAVFWSDPEEVLKAVTKKAEELAKEALTGTDKEEDKEEGITGIQIIFFVRDMKSRICLERTFAKETVKALRAMARRCSGNKDLGMHCTYVLLKKYDSQEVKLKGLRRHEMMQMPPIQGKINQEGGTEVQDVGEKLSALVFTVDLYQLAGLYNLIGDRLFKDNVRLGIRETLGVNDSIRRTLETEPELFWFKNNGVTILVEDPDFMPRTVEELKLGEIGPEKEPDFSVVNGAQTITVAARCFFDMEYDWQESKKDSREQTEFLKRLDYSKQAQVLLKIIRISGDKNGDRVSETVKEISVALNRQKPIKMEDIAFTLPFIEKLARYLERRDADDRERFLLVRRGEESGMGQEMDLVEFARARLACIGRPGEARSQGAGTLLKIQTEEDPGDTFQRKDIFVPEWMEADEEEESDLFRHHYGALWFAHETAKEYDKQRKNAAKGESSHVAAVINNGKWYFTAALVHMLGELTAEVGDKGREPYDYSRFAVPFSAVRESIPEAMKCFARIVDCLAEEKEEYRGLSSNLFKRNDLYREIMGEITKVHRAARHEDEEGRLEREIRKLPGLFPVVEKAFAQAEAAAGMMENGAELMGAAPGALGVRPDVLEKTVKETQKRKTVKKKDTGFLILNGKEYRWTKLSMAQAYIAEYILTNYEVTEELLEEVSDWMTDREEAGTGKTGYFRSVQKIEVKGKAYWVGTSSNFEVKCRQARRLCRGAGVREQEIRWYVDSSEEPVFCS